MAGFYQIVTTGRTTLPDLTALLATLRATDPTIGIQPSADGHSYTLKKNTAWTAPQIASAQAALDAASAATPQLSAQSAVDAYPIELRALVLALVDQLNVVRAALPTPLVAITPAQALSAIRAKAGQL